MEINDINKKLTEIAINLKSNMKQINYKTIELLCLNIMKMDLKPIKEDSLLRYDQMINIVYECFKSIDHQFYEKVVTILTDNPNIMVYNANNINPEDEYYKQFIGCNGELAMFWHPQVDVLDDQLIIYLPYQEKYSDIFTYCHELAHTFDILACRNKINGSTFLSEITPLIIEKLFEQYLNSTGYNDANLNHQAFRLNDTISKAKEVLPVIIMINTIIEHDELNYDTIKQYVEKNDKIIEQYSIDNSFDSFFKNTICPIPDFCFENFNQTAKYISADAISANFCSNYNLNSFISYIETIGDVKMNDSLSILGVELDENGNCLNQEELITSFHNYYGDNKSTKNKVKTFNR